MSPLGIFDSSKGLGGKFVAKQLGGLKVYARTTGALDDGVGRLASSIAKVSQVSGPLNPSLLRYLVGLDLEQEVPRRCFSAVLGQQLRLGHLDAVLGEGHEGTPFRILLHKDRQPAFSGIVRATGLLVITEREVKVSDLRDRYFPGPDKGNWTKASFAAARVVRLGVARWQDRFSVSAATSVLDALQHVGAKIPALDA